MSDKKDLGELLEIIQQAWRRIRAVSTFCFRHKKTGAGQYDIKEVVIRESDLTPLVVYERRAKPNEFVVPFARPLDEFLEKFEEWRIEEHR